MRIRFYILASIMLMHSCLMFSQNPAKAYLNFAQGAKKVSHVDTLGTSAHQTIEDKWEEFTVSEGQVKQEKPILDKLPTAALQQSGSTTLRVSEVIDTIPEIWGRLSTDSFIPIGTSDDSNFQTVHFDFYGVGQIVSIPKEYGTFHPKGISEQDVDQFWQLLASHNFSRIISDCNKYKVALGFNDWAILKWAQDLAKAIFPDNINSEQEIFTVFLLNQIGLQVRVSRVNEQLVTLFASMQNVYAKKYIVIDTAPYYLAEDIPSASKIYTYRSGYNKSARPLDLRIPKPLRLGDGTTEIKLAKYSTVWECNMQFSIPSSLSQFYNEYPQLDAKIYATASPSDGFLNVFEKILQPTNNRDNVRFINQLLSFLHLDFKYMVDQEQFGIEKPFFCEENFIYPYNDCEDRSILLSSLIRNLLGLKVVLLDYSDHMAVAVNISENIKGDHLVLSGERYYVCDPTYIGSTIGMSIPKYKSQPAKVYIL